MRKYSEEIPLIGCCLPSPTSGLQQLVRSSAGNEEGLPLGPPVTDRAGMTQHLRLHPNCQDDPLFSAPAQPTWERERSKQHLTLPNVRKDEDAATEDVGGENFINLASTSTDLNWSLRDQICGPDRWVPCAFTEHAEHQHQHLFSDELGVRGLLLAELEASFLINPQPVSQSSECALKFKQGLQRLPASLQQDWVPNVDSALFLLPDLGSEEPGSQDADRGI